LAATADATELDDLGLVNAQFPHGVDNALADAVMPTALAQRGRLAAIFGLLQAQRISFWGTRDGSALLYCFHFFPLLCSALIRIMWMRQRESSLSSVAVNWHC